MDQNIHEEHIRISCLVGWDTTNFRFYVRLIIIELLQSKMGQEHSIRYRKDIDGLRAIAVLAVLFFHLGYLPNGYLGVDVFFAISGFLITKIVYTEALENRFSIRTFYLRRIRRIIPLVLTITFVALLLGLLVMLPNDLENLSQSAFATNVFANNILLLISSMNYWDIVNDYKPLMHTWSLGIEEQFYLIYPLLFLFLNGKKARWALPVLLVLTLVSLLLFTTSTNESSRFCLIQYRFFELSIGGIGAIIFQKKPIKSSFKLLLLPIVLLILFVDFKFSGSLKIVLIVLATTGLLISEKHPNTFETFLLENKLMVGIGKISFSLYMWHQLVLAFTRYYFIQHFDVLTSVWTILLIIVLSIVTYYAVEQPFRDKAKIRTNVLFYLLGPAFLISTCLSLYLYKIQGIVRDVPELELYKSKSYSGNIYMCYNEHVRQLNQMFSDNDKIKVLVIGNSFARDWANILLESKFGKRIELSYVEKMDECRDVNLKLTKADYLFFSVIDREAFKALSDKYPIDTSKCWYVGTKNFGSNNGIFYSNRGSRNYRFQRTSIDPWFVTLNDTLKRQWGYKYIDLIGMNMNVEGKVPVFTPHCQFISQDGRHLTHAGAVYFAENLDFDRIFQKFPRH